MTSMQVGITENLSISNRFCSAIRSGIQSITDCAIKVARVAAPVFGAAVDFADGYIRGTSTFFGLVGLFFVVLNPPAALSIALVAIGVILLSKKVLGDFVAPSCYRFGNVREDHPLRWVPFLGGAYVSVIQFQGASLFF